MKAKEVLSLLGISRTTLRTYVKKGIIKVSVLPNGYYDYDKDTVFALVNGNKSRYNAIYCRVSTFKQKNDLETQLQYVQDFCSSNSVVITNVYKDIASGINLERNQITSLLNDILNYKVDTIYISYRDRLSRLSFSLLEQIFNKFGTRIIIVSDVLNKRTNIDDDYELFEDIIALMHYFSTKKYSHRRRK